jgi:AraC-like DNA-binding protein
MDASHVHADLELNYVYRGTIVYFLAGRFVEAPVGKWAAFWAAMPHQTVEVSPDSELLWLSVPLVVLFRWSLGNHFVQRLMRGDMIVDVHALAWDGEQARLWCQELATDSPESRHTVELEVEARLRRLASRSRLLAAPAAAERKGRRQAESIAAYLARNFRDEITAKDIGEAVELHPTNAMKVFRRECGTSIWSYLTRLRLSRAQHLLLSTTKTVVSIALESGFGSLPRFYAAFRRECRTSPLEYRRRLGSGGTQASPAEGPDSRTALRDGGKRRTGQTRQH